MEMVTSIYSSYVDLNMPAIGLHCSYTVSHQDELWGGGGGGGVEVQLHEHSMEGSEAVKEMWY